MSVQRKIFERVLNMAQMHNIGVIHKGADMFWTCRWNEAGRESSICYQIARNTFDDSLKLRLHYDVLKEGRGENRLLDYAIPIKTSLSYKRKVWYWFTCPLTINGSPCKRRVRNLYFLPGSEYFGCKYCRDLMLRSLPPAQRFLFFRTEARQPRAAGAETAGGNGAGFIPELRLGWRPTEARTICRKCGCLTEGAYCCNCGASVGEDKMENLFEVLGTTVRATPEELRQAFLGRMKEYHPDRVAHLGVKLRTVAEQEIKRINRAYEIVSDPVKRKAYVIRVAQAAQNAKAEKAERP